MLAVSESTTNNTSTTTTTSSSTFTAAAMLTSGSNGNQYIQPDYLSPLPTTLDAKRSPLALLAQTCSQIGADPTPPATTSTSSSTLSASNSSSSSSSSINCTSTTSTSNLKATDNNGKANTGKKNNNNDDGGHHGKSSSKTPPVSNKHQTYDYRREELNITIRADEQQQHKSGFKSPSSVHKSQNNGNSSSTSSPPTTTTTSTSLAASALQMDSQQRAALEAAMAIPKDLPSPLGSYRPSPVFPPLSGLSGMSGLSSLPGLSPYHHHPGLSGLDAATAAALGAFRHPAYASAAHHLGYPPVSLGQLSHLAGYQQALAASSYGRLKSSESMTNPVCRDPYCTGCPASAPPPSLPVSSSSSTGLSLHHAMGTSTSSSSHTATSSSSPTMSTAASICPAGCTQCDHQKIPASSASTGTPTVSSAAAAASSPTGTRPYVCNWIAADSYCGKRFGSSDELLQHLRTHTSLSVPSLGAPSMSSSSSASAANSLEAGSPYSPLTLNPSLHPHSHLLAASALHRTYPTPPLSPLSIARYHPYAAAAAAAAAAGHGKPSPQGQQQSSPSPLSAASVGGSSQASAVQAQSQLAPSLAQPNPAAALLSLHHPYPSLAGLGAYYSHPYSLYSQRMLGAGVFP